MDGPILPSLLERTFSLNQAAGPYTLLTASGDVKIKKVSVYCTAAAAGPLTSVRVHTNQTTAYDFLTAVEGALANLVAQSNLAMASQASGLEPQLRSGQLIQVTIAGGASATGDLKIVVEWRPISGNGMLS